ncbi:hypothetical protein QVD17_06515 [Tagetes erecta]|uniref:Uncharacterized protein n=1 Tax=Tagetes erecta TaxID=13708 RepID=A0AAD8PCA2_TARER|nr:hypothetical protein QVD17_06515 [Tagetes erecta]
MFYSASSTNLVHNLIAIVFISLFIHFIPTCCSFWPIIDPNYEYNIKYTGCFHSRTSVTGMNINSTEVCTPRE